MKHVTLLIVALINAMVLINEANATSPLADDMDFKTKMKSALECDTCYVILPAIRLLVEHNETSYLNTVCSKLKIEDNTVCNSILSQYQSAVVAVAKNSPLSSKDLCSAILNCAPITNPVFNWNVTLPNVPKPAVVPFVAPKQDAPKARILHISDIHIDFEYQPGSIANCGQPLCCRNSSTIKKKHAKVAKNFKSNKAGYWGDYRNCDTPLWTIENMFDHISKNEEFDFIYMTGDIPPHNVWNQTKSEQLHAIDVLTDLFLKYFPNKVIYSTLGNHEAAPCNLFPTPGKAGEEDISWLYSHLSKNWVRTGLPQELAQNISSGAFYSTKIASGLRLISLNMNYCYNLNFWLLIDSVDPLGQLAWLMRTLQESENNGEKVHIIGHVDPMGCFESWSKSYYEIVNRYESTITGQFFGHTHFDQFEMFYDLQNLTRPVGIAYVTGSITTFNYDNPNYRIYSVDGDYKDSTWHVLDHENYFMNLTEANISNEPKWELEYTAKDAFGMKSLEPEEWGNLLNTMTANLNGTLVDKLYTYLRKSNLNFKTSDCDMECRKEFVCSFKQARSDSFIPC